MKSLPRLLNTLAAALAACLLAASAAAAAPPGGGIGGLWLAKRLARTTTGPSAFADLRAFQRIADRSGGTRAPGTPGDLASARYVARRLSAAGYQVERQTVPYTDFQLDAEQAQEVTPTPRNIRVLMMYYSPSTPTGGFTAPLVVTPANTPTAGCSASDYAGLPVRGSIVLAPHSTCGYTAEEKVIASLGGLAMILYFVVPSPEDIWRLQVFSPGDFTIPGGTVSEQTADLLAADAASHPVLLHLEMRGHDVRKTTENIFAQTRGGRADRVVMAGAHLDSVREGPGINDNASSAAALLETAISLAPYQDRVRNMVRFAWWGAEELVDIGSTYYVSHLTAAQQGDIALYIDFELIASPNFARFVYDGGAQAGGTPGPAGSGAVENVIEGYFNRAHLPYEPQDITAIGSDHEPFMAAGIPVGGMYLGTLGVKTPAEAAIFGGQAGQMYDHCYHQACDTIMNINRTAFDQNVPAIAFTVGRFAIDVSDVEAQRAGQ
jgi:Peptidase family M28/PA domain